jgi:hypothetical protein
MDTTKELDQKTIAILLKEAEKKYKAADARFRKDDNADDMHEADAWYLTRDWLSNLSLRARVK